jgi:hypothetical protein
MDLSHMHFVWPFYLYLVPLALLVLFARGPCSVVLLTVHSNLLEGLRKVSLWRLALPRLLFGAGIFCVIIAQAEPQVLTVLDKLVFVERYIAAALDNSGSMEEGVTADDTKFAQEEAQKDGSQGDYPAAGQAWQKYRIAAMGLKHLFKLIPTDLVALFIFDERCKYLDVPTTDLNELAEHLEGLHPDGGTNFAGMGEKVDGQPRGAIAELLAVLHELAAKDATRIGLIITDGDDNIPDDKPAMEFSTLAQQLSDEHIHFYVIGIGESWYQDQWRTKLDLARLTDKVNGTIIRVGNKSELLKGLASIAALEKRETLHKSETETKQYFQYCMFLGLLFVIGGLLARKINGEEI